MRMTVVLAEASEQPHAFPDPLPPGRNTLRAFLGGGLHAGSSALRLEAGGAFRGASGREAQLEARWTGKFCRSKTPVVAIQAAGVLEAAGQRLRVSSIMRQSFPEKAMPYILTVPMPVPSKISQYFRASICRIASRQRFIRSRAFIDSVRLSSMTTPTVRSVSQKAMSE